MFTLFHILFLAFLLTFIVRLIGLQRKEGV